MVLADDVGEPLGTILPGNNLVGHGVIKEQNSKRMNPENAVL
jgi:hypothetical protein